MAPELKGDSGGVGNFSAGPVLLLTTLMAQVIGIDVYPYPVPEDIPPNLDFQVDDLNSP